MRVEQAGQAVAELAKQLYLFSQVELEGFIMPDIDQDRVVGRPNQGLIRKLEIFSSGSAPGHKQTQHAPADPRCGAWFSSMKTRNDFLFLFGPSNNDNGWSNELFIKQTYDRDISISIIIIIDHGRSDVRADRNK